MAAVQTFGRCHTPAPIKALKVLDSKENDRTVLISAGALLTVLICIVQFPFAIKLFVGTLQTALSMRVLALSGRLFGNAQKRH